MTLPILLGRVALGTGAMPPLPGGMEGLRLLYRGDGGRTECYATAGAAPALSLRHDGGYAMLFGQVHGVPARPAEVLKASPSALPGEYVLFRMEEGPGGAKVEAWTDRFGFRTLYYARHAEHLCFATHLHGVLRLLGRRGGLDGRALLHYYHFGVTPGEDTLLAGIRKVPAAGCLSVRASVATVTRWADPLDLRRPEETRGRDMAELAVALRERLAASVRRRHDGGQTVGLALSGGVDSGLLAQQLVDQGLPFRAYNLSYGAYYDEHDRVDRLAQDLGIEVVRLRAEAGDVLAEITRAAGTGSEPVAFNDAALRLVARQARADGLDTLWDGDGADRLFLGMNSHLKIFRVLRGYRALQKLGLAGPVAAAAARVPHPGARKLALVLQAWRHGLPPYIERRHDPSAAFDAAAEEAVFDLGARRLWDDYRARADAKDTGLFFTYMAVRLCPELFFHTPIEQQQTLGLRPVSPYWDEDVVAFALSLPTAAKIRRGRTKYVLRRAAGGTAYWMLPKVGLQSAFAFLQTTPQGYEWVEDARRRARASALYGRLEAALGRPPEVDRLLPACCWHDALKASWPAATTTTGAPAPVGGG